MNFKRRLSRFLPSLCLLAALAPDAAFACIWPYSEPAFWREMMTGPERDALLAGKVGIVDNDWSDPGLFAAWRHFEGLGIPQERRRELWTDGRGDDYGAVSEATAEELAPPPSALDRWSAAVEKVTGEEFGGLSPEFYGDVTNDKGETEWLAFLNCLDPAFDTAAAALEERAKRWGKDSRELKEWLSGQQQVFANCAAVGTSPAELGAPWPAELRADRQYQIAAADFYGLRYAAAEQRFRQIAADQTSPWRAAAALSAARAVLRRGQAAEAAAEFRKLAQDASLGELQASARRLADFAEMRADARQAAARLEKELHQKTLPPDLLVEIYGARWLSRRIDPPSPDLPLIYFLRSISSWMIPASEVYAHWKKSPSDTSLVVALLRASEAWAGRDKGQDEVEEPVKSFGKAESEALAAAAAKVEKGSPAYLSARFYRASLLSALGRTDEARAELDRLLAEKVGDRSDVQRLRHDRAHLARNWQELIEFGLLTPLGETDADETRVYDIGDEVEAGEDRRLLIPVAREAIDRFASLAELAQLQKNEALPTQYRRDLALAGFLRAALQGKETEAEAFAAAAQAIEPELAGLFAEWRAEPAAGRKFAAALLALRQPGLSIDLPPFWGRRSTPLDEIDSSRENWWCAVEQLPADEHRPAFLRGKEAPADGAFGWSSGPNHLGRIVLAFAKENPNDERLPEALHRTVRATRFGCFGEPYKEVSKGAFDLLHKRFPKSEWAAQTKYWFE